MTIVILCYGKSALTQSTQTILGFFRVLHSTIYHNRIASKSQFVKHVNQCKRRNGTEDNVLLVSMQYKREIFNKIKWNMIMWWWVAVANAQVPWLFICRLLKHLHQLSTQQYREHREPKKKVIKGSYAIWEFFKPFNFLYIYSYVILLQNES